MRYNNMFGSRLLAILLPICGLLQLTTDVIGAHRREYTDVDKLRSELFDLRNVFKNTGRGASPGEGTYMRLLQSYDDFTRVLGNAPANGSKNRLNGLNSLWLWARVQTEMKNIEGLYSTFEQRLSEAVARTKRFDIDEWTIFAKTILEDANISIPKALDRIDDIVVHQNLFFSAYQEAATQICNEKQSPQQLLYNLYKTITFTEIKGFTMMQFSYTLLRLYNNGTFNEEMKKTEKDWNERTSETMTAVKTAMTYAPRELWRCDPGIHKEGSTYIQLKQLFQGYIVNEVDLNPTSTCKENCGYYNFATVNSCYGNQFCGQQRRCNGKVLNCHYVDSDMWICPSAGKSDRRYEYIEYENGRVYGQKQTCSRGTTKVDSWWRWLFWHCSYCMCYCDDHNSSSDRYFSLREATSDVESNKVITGIKLTKTNKIVHLQIQEGILLPQAEINESSVAWKKIDNFTVLDRDVENGRDYHTLAWERRGLDLDDLVGLESHLLTGVRFRLVGTHLNFEIRVTPFNFTSGKLIKPMEKSTWQSNDYTETSEKARTELKLVKPDIPTRTAPSVPDSRTNQYLNFAPTDLEKDAAQTTVPFLDIQPVVTNPPFPLSGAGIFHKGREGSGGFVAPRVVTYDFSKHIDSDLPPPTPILRVNEIRAV